MSSTVGILPARGSGLTDLARSGQHERLLDYDLRAYAEAFDRVDYFSYFSERLADFTLDPMLMERVRVVPRPQWPALRQCYALRVEQFSGVLPAVIARALWGTPFVVSHGYDYAAVARANGARLKPFLYRALERLALPRAAGIIATTPVTPTSPLAPYAARVSVIPNGVDLARFSTPRSRRQPGERRRVLYVGRLEPEKNVGRLIEALALIKSPTVELIVIGTGSQRSALLAHAARLGVTASFTGVVPYQHVPSWFADADVFVLPSLTEGHPKVILEAMAAGVPIAASARGGIVPLIGNNVCGLLFDPEEPTSIASAVTTLLTDRVLSVSLPVAARAFVEQFDLRPLLHREVNLVASVIPSGASRAAPPAVLHPSPRFPMPAAAPGEPWEDRPCR